ncbi:cobaltochelatase subunit CobN [Pararhizobium mangrovi]|uniref:Cobaltochelatase subunit CobN n=1 Tax=Pararhizobium mangrovi TaxID=2590452 RepID=A0A506U1J7_9HYPH|nr:cobaltochelatase subunit CobN [Pararhizobium mangrovi]TPW27131.1 cobaltochelatase subunit CobN [Pararhizobium mangrovi]
MHLLLAQKGTIADGEEAIDLGQTPGDVCVLSAADTELASLAAAQGQEGSRPSLRLASLMQLKHPMSVDTYVERTARHARLIVVRALGGASYFAYALEALHAAAVTHRIALAVLPGDDKPDEGLAAFSTVDANDREALWHYLIEGGPANATAFLDYCVALIEGGEKPGTAAPLLKAGLWDRAEAVPQAWTSLLNGKVRAEGAGGGDVDHTLRSDKAQASPLPISPLAGEMPARAEGGTSPQAKAHASSAEAASSSIGIATEETKPTVAVCFYRALVQSGQTEPVEALCRALEAEGMRALPVFVASLKDPVSVDTLRTLFARTPPDVVVNATGFAVSAPGGERTPTVLDEAGAPVLQAVFSASAHEAWETSAQGLAARDLAMNVALPEVDGRVLTRAVSFKSAARYDAATEANIVAHEPDAGRCRFVARLAANWARLSRTPAARRRVAVVLANYPNRDGRLGNGVGLDTPAGTIEALRAMAAEGYPVADLPADGDALIAHLMAGPTNAAIDAREIRETMSLDAYRAFFATLPERVRDEVTDRWDDPVDDPFVAEGRFCLPLARFGETLIGVQPARGYNIDPKETYHSPDLVPPHGYLAFYAYLRETCGVHAIVHMGKHGNLEWLPGKALALSETCYPEAVYGPVPQLYPFIVNDPGEGTQAKRRTAAVVIDHLTPPLTRAESYGVLRDLEALVDEYYEASGNDPRRLRLLRGQILDLIRDTGLDADAGIAAGEADDTALEKLDAYLCDLKEVQIRDGLHIFGRAPEGRLLTDLTVALARVPRGNAAGEASLQRAIAGDLGLSPSSDPSGHLLPGGEKGERSAGRTTPSPQRGEGGSRSETDGGAGASSSRSRNAEASATPDLPPCGGDARQGRGGQVATSAAVGDRAERVHPPLSASPTSPQQGERSGAEAFDPLDCDMAQPWRGLRPAILANLGDDPWRTAGDTVERIELLAAKLVAGETACPADWMATRAVLEAIETRIKPSIVRSGPAEIEGLLTGLAGRFVPPGPSGAPTRGRPDVLPTGRNFYSVDSRSVPTPAAWELGRKSAEMLVARYTQEHGDWPSSFGLTAWGTSNMRTGGDDIAQAMALIGAKPVWDHTSRRVTGYEIIPPATLGRPRVDVTLRISGFFRDAFPDQIALFDRAVRAIGALDENEGENPIAERMRAERAALEAEGTEAGEAERRSGHRVFGSKPGAYGAGLQALIDEKGWDERGDLAEAYMVWGSYAYGAGSEGEPERGAFEARLGSLEAVVHNQDNREHDLLDSDDYYQFEGGMTAAVEAMRGTRPPVYHNDHSRPERPVIRSLEEEIGRVVRGRVVNPKWIDGVMRHGYKGAFEIAATVDYLFAFSATTGAVRDHHFEAVYQAFVGDERVRAFMEEKNPAALKEMADRLAEAIERGLWQPKSNSAQFDLRAIANGEETP